PLFPSPVHPTDYGEAKTLQKVGIPDAVRIDAHVFHMHIYSYRMARQGRTRMQNARPKRPDVSKSLLEAGSGDGLAEGDGSVGHTVGEAPLVVVPGHDAHEVALDHLGLV